MFVSSRIHVEHKLDLQVVGQLLACTDAPVLHLDVTENSDTSAAVQEVVKCCFYLFTLGGLQLLLHVQQTLLHVASHNLFCKNLWKQ